MTEEEAKKKWCPFARVTLRTGHGSGNRTMVGDWGGSGHSNEAIERKAACIGSACMAWRTSDEMIDLPTGMKPEGNGWEEKQTRGVGGAVTQRTSWKRDIGYCGLAGKP